MTNEFDLRQHDSQALPSGQPDAAPCLAAAVAMKVVVSYHELLLRGS